VKRTAFLAPLLLLYLMIVLATSDNELRGDEPRYLWFANNLARGYYSPADDASLWNGPGYPLVLLPFVLLKLPLILAKILNAFFLFGAVLCFHRAIRLYAAERQATVFAYLFGVYPPLVRQSNALLTESLGLFLVSGFMLFFCRLHRSDSRSRVSLLLASGFLAYLALTKIFFGYVLAAMLLWSLVFGFFRRTPALKKTRGVFALALAFCVPYLAYTYSLTGRLFCWGDSGGMSLYWLSSPHANELGDWYSDRDVRMIPELAENHGAFFEEISKLNHLERDDAFKKRALENFARHPRKIAENWSANVGRLLFSYPFSYTPQKLSTYFYLVPNMFLVVLSVLSLYPAFRARERIGHEIRLLLLFASLAFLGSSFLSAYERQFRVIVPIVGLWLTFVLTRIVALRIRGAQGDS